ncbi:MAG: DNA gyrase inhibitor YacG [Pseudomonadota bacterium]
MSTPVVACPTCGKETIFAPDNPDRPFCSERCRLLDLGAWADGRHHIPGEPATFPESGDDVDPDRGEGGGGPL